MKTNLERAKELLVADGYTCVLVNKDVMLTSYERGVKPLLNWYQEGVSLEGFSAADKVIGKAAAYLYVLLGVKEIYVGVISIPALKVLEENHILVTYDTLVEAIRNREGTGFCPMEKAVWDIDNPDEAVEAIRKLFKTFE